MRVPQGLWTPEGVGQGVLREPPREEGAEVDGSGQKEAGAGVGCSGERDMEWEGSVIGAGAEHEGFGVKWKP